MGVNPISSYFEGKQIQQNPVGYGLGKAYGSEISNSSTPTATGKTNLANAVRGFMTTGDFIGAAVGFASNAISPNRDVTPFTAYAAYTNPVGFAVGSLYGAEMSRSTEKTSTGHTNIANSILGGLAFGGVGAVVGFVANLIGELFGGSKDSKSNETNKTSDITTFGDKNYTGFGSDSYGISHGLMSVNFGQVGYTGFGSAEYGIAHGYGSGMNTNTNDKGSFGYGDSSYIGYGSTGYSGFGSDSYGAANGLSGGNNSPGGYSGYGSPGYGGFGSDSYGSGLGGSNSGNGDNGGNGNSGSDSGGSDTGGDTGSYGGYAG